MATLDETIAAIRTHDAQAGAALIDQWQNALAGRTAPGSDALSRHLAALGAALDHAADDPDRLAQALRLLAEAVEAEPGGADLQSLASALRDAERDASATVGLKHPDGTRSVGRESPKT